jgi:hypothetical protein
LTSYETIDTLLSVHTCTAQALLSPETLHRLRLLQNEEVLRPGNVHDTYPDTCLPAERPAIARGIPTVIEPLDH